MIRVIIGVVFCIVSFFQPDEHIKWFMILFGILLMVWDDVVTLHSDVVENQKIIDKKIHIILDRQTDINENLKKIEENSR